MATRDNTPAGGYATGANGGFKPGRDINPSRASDQADELRQNTASITTSGAAKKTPSMTNRTGPDHTGYGTSTDAARGTTSSLTGTSAEASRTGTATGATHGDDTDTRTWADVQAHTQTPSQRNWGSSRYLQNKYLQKPQQALTNIRSSPRKYLAAAIGVGFLLAFMYRRRNQVGTHHNRRRTP